MQNGSFNNTTVSQGVSSLNRRRTRSPSPDNSVKKSRYSPSSSRPTTSNGMGTQLNPLSLSILGVEPLDEFITEIADFIHKRIMSRLQHPDGQVEVEAKLGLLKPREENMRAAFPVLSETSARRSIPFFFFFFFHLINFSPVLATSDHRFESNMTAVRNI